MKRRGVPQRGYTPNPSPLSLWSPGRAALADSHVNQPNTILLQQEVHALDSVQSSHIRQRLSDHWHSINPILKIKRPRLNQPFVTYPNSVTLHKVL